MFDHVSIGVADIARSKKFYDAALKPLGFSLLSDGESSLGYGEKAVQLWLGATKKPVKADMESGLHFCFLANDRDGGRCLPCRRAEGRRQGQRQARRARRLRAEILRRVCDRPRRLSHRGLLRKVDLAPGSSASNLGAMTTRDVSRWRRRPRGCRLRHPDPGLQRRSRDPLDVARAQGLPRGLPALRQGLRRRGLREGQRASHRLGRRRAVAAARSRIPTRRRSAR